MRAIMLVLTEKCNLACTYCYENKKAVQMDFPRARQILERELKDQLEGQQDELQDKHLTVYFFGGEPFANFETMKKVYEYMEETHPELSVVYNVTTNGTLVHGQIRDWLEERKDHFCVTLSLDGTEEMHNRSRLDHQGRGSYEMIDIDFFRKTWEKCLVKMTISEYTLSDFANGIKHIESLGFLCKANFASGVDYHLRENREIIQKNIQELIDYYSENDRPLCYMLNLDLKAVLRPVDEKFRYCGAGKTRHCYGPRSDKWYPCQGLMPMAAGQQDFSGETFEKDSLQEISSCGKCPWIRICKNCYAVNYAGSGSVWEPDSQLCYLNRLCMLASARIQYNRLKRDKKDDPLLVRAIYQIASELNSI